ncbi:uncharacterized protein LOC135823069 [Sycon ciliatum]|uniref:uncharacterized protein LOC135823069 n=1 Tax=Sycon ciliatum TaxID=27933 RepID=UPI0020A8B9F2|eukprot:scpid89892/ scgid33986/ 
MIRVALLLAFAASAYSHLCLLAPHQRGSSAGFNTPGADNCGLTASPCGGRPLGRPSVALPSGEKVNITIQKNLNHFNADKPGHFLVSYGSDEKMQAIGMTPDTNTSSPWIYELSVEIPRTEKHEMGIMQVQYVTSNPNAPAVFYQCADVAVVPRHH